MECNRKRRVWEVFSGHLAVALLCGAVGSAGAVVVVGGDNGWEVSFDGNVNGFLVYEDGDAKPRDTRRSQYNYPFPIVRSAGTGGLSTRQTMESAPAGDDSNYEEECGDELGFFSSGGGCGSTGDSFSSDDDSFDESDSEDGFLDDDLLFLSAPIPAGYGECTGDDCHIYTSITARLTGGTLGDGTRVSRVRTGLLPAFFSFNVRSPEVHGLRGAARVSFAPQIQNANTKNQFGSQVDLREVFFNVEGGFGTFSVGRTLSLFQRQSILNDMTLFGVGVQGGADGGGTTLGRIGYGYVYPQFNARISYRTPVVDGFQAEVGMYDPSKICHERGTCAKRTKIPRFEAELTYASDYDQGGFKGWFGAMWQEAETATDQEVTAWGVSGGLQFSYQGLALTGAGYTGEALGSVLMLDSDSLDVLGNERDNHGWYIQGTYRMGSLTLGVSYGENNSDQTSVDRSIRHNTTLPRQVQALFNSLGAACRNTATETNVFQSGGVKQLSAGCATALGALPRRDPANPREDRTLAVTMPVPIDKLSSLTFGAYYEVSSWLRLIGEYSRVTNDWHDWAGQDFEVDSNVFSVGSFFLW